MRMGVHDQEDPGGAGRYVVTGPEGDTLRTFSYQRTKRSKLEALCRASGYAEGWREGRENMAKMF